MYIRLIFNSELTSIQQNEELTGMNEYPPYAEGEVICLFETDDVAYIVERYGEACATTRFEEREDGILNCTIISFDPLDIENLEVDKSQNGWPESRAYHGTIPIENIQEIGTVQFLAEFEAMITYQPETLVIHPVGREL